MSSPGEPDLERAEVVPATLGSTTANAKHAFLQGDGTIHDLPWELHVNIMAHLANDPVSQVCFGLTSSYFYQIYHEVLDQRYETGKRKYNIKSFPLDLAMQVSVCGMHIIFGWYEWWFLIDAPDIKWERSLGDLLSEERWLWRQRAYCQCCRKYKPAAAFEKSDFEFRMFEEHNEKLMQLEGNMVEENLKKCQYCRVKALLVFLTGREEVMEFPHPLQESRSMGLAKETCETPNANTLAEADSWEKHDAIVRGYERWEDIFARLNI